MNYERLMPFGRRMQLLLGLIAIGALVLVAAPSARAGTLHLNSCSAYHDLGRAFSNSGSGGISEANQCGEGGSLQISGGLSVGSTQDASWETISPPDVLITAVVTPLNDVLVTPSSSGYVSDYFWDTGSQPIPPQNGCCGGMDYGLGINRSLPPGHHFGWEAACHVLDGTCKGGQILDVSGVSLTATDSTPPALTAAGSPNIWNEGGHWIRGPGWPASFGASDEVGVCSMRIVVGGVSIQGPGPLTPDTSSWVQCPTPLVQQDTLDTTQYVNGPLPITFSASDAAGNVDSPVVTPYIDNSPVTLRLSAPSDVATTAATATAEVSAAASNNPSGSSIICSVDGGPSASYVGPSAQIPMSGLGSHSVSCHAQDGATDVSGTPGESATQTATVSIRQPTAEAISFTRITGLRCREVRVRARVRGRERTMKRHGRTVVVPGRIRTVTRSVRRCEERTVRRSITVTVRRHGRKIRLRKIVTVVVAPHVKLSAARRVAYGQGTTLSGDLALTDGTPLAGRTVRVLAAPDNGLGQFAPIATVTTSANGTWSAVVPPGPSRMIEAVYGGSSTEEPVTSTPVVLTVPAKVRLTVTRRAAWGGTVRIVGRLLGGYLPAGGALVRLREGYGRARTTIGVVQHVTGRGYFSTSFTFGPGPAGLRARYWFSASVLPQPDYPFAASSSPRRYVIVGGHPPGV